MAIKSRKSRKPAVFARKSKASDGGKSEDDTLDMLLHYAKAGMEYAEQSLEASSGSYSPSEREALLQNKNMLEQAPKLVDKYKSRINEYDVLHKKMIGILQKCEEIVSTGDQKAKQEVKDVLKEAQVFTYIEDDDIVLKKD